MKKKLFRTQTVASFLKLVLFSHLSIFAYGQRSRRVARSTFYHHQTSSHSFPLIVPYYLTSLQAQLAVSVSEFHFHCRDGLQHPLTPPPPPAPRHLPTSAPPPTRSLHLPPVQREKQKRTDDLQVGVAELRERLSCASSHLHRLSQQQHVHPVTAGHHVTTVQTQTRSIKHTHI